MARRPGPSVVLLLLAWLVAGSLAMATPARSAESKSGGAHAPEGEAPAAREIPAGEVPLRSQQVQAFLLEARSRAGIRPDVAEIAEELPEFAKTIGTRAARDVDLLSGEVPHRATLFNIVNDWKAREDRLASWRRTLSTRSAVLAGDVERLSELSASWERTQQAAQKGESSQALLKLVDATLRQVAKTRGVIDRRLAPILRLQDQVVQLERTTESVLRDVAASQDRIRRRLLVRDSPPIWQARYEGDRPIGSAIFGLLRDELAQIGDFAGMRVDGLIGLAVLGLLLWALLRLLAQPAVRASGEDESLLAAARILSRPISASVLIWLLISIFTFRAAPLLLIGTAAILLAVPVLRLLPGSLATEVRWPIYGLAAWFGIEVIRQILVPEMIVARLILLAESVAAVFIFAWLLRPARLSLVGHPSGTLRATGAGIRLLVPVAVVATIANVAGNVGLAEVLVEGSLIGLYLVFTFYTVRKVLEGAWLALLQVGAVRSLRMVQNHEPILRLRGSRFLSVSSIVLWTHVTLEAFHIRTPTYDWIWRLLTAKVLVGDLEFSLGDFVLAGLMVWLAFLISRLVRFVLDEDVLPRASLPRGVAFAISTSVRYVILVIGFMLAVAATGMDTSRFALMLGALGVGVGIGLQDVVNNFVSGLILLFERPIQQGDTVEVEGTYGTIRRIGLRSSTLRTFDGSEVVIPNSRFVSQQFVNWTLSDHQRRVDLPVGVAYGSDPERVMEILLEVAGAHGDVLRFPAAVALFCGFGDSSLDFELRVWLPRFEDWLQVRSDLGVAVIHALEDAGIEIPFPQRDLHLRSVSAELAGGAPSEAGRQARDVP